jgi:molecular chaperone GrpE (heat shock protein)
VSDYQSKPLGLEDDPGGNLDNISIDDPTAQLSALAEERDRLLVERSDLNDRLLRRTAEFDNFRKRIERERLDHTEYAGMETVKALLPILDDFDRAVKQPCSDAVYAKGVELIHSRFYEILKKTGRNGGERRSGRPDDPRRISAGLPVQRQASAAFHGESGSTAIERK